MKVTFLGVGEACDQDYPNTSIIINGADNQNVLLDCGFTTPHIFFKRCSEGDYLDGVWISHFHGDHFFGIPLLLLRFWEIGRQKPLVIIGGRGVQERVKSVTELAYPGFWQKLKFRLEFLELLPSMNIERFGFAWRSAMVNHSQEALAVKITDQSSAMFYSGDGRPTQESLELAKVGNLVIHESYAMIGDTPGHANIATCLDFSRQAGVKNLALVHIARKNRSKLIAELDKLRYENSDLNISIPEPDIELYI